MVAKRGQPECEQAGLDSARLGAARSAKDLTDYEINASNLVFRPLPGARSFHEQPSSWESTVAASHASAPQSADDNRVGLVHRRLNQIISLSIVFAVGIIIGVGATSVMFAPGLSQTFRSLAAAARGGFDRMASSRERDPPNGGAPIDAMARPAQSPEADNSIAGVVEQPRRGFSGQALDALQTAPPVSPSIAGEDVTPASSTPDAENGSPQLSETTSSSHPAQLPTISNKGGASVIEEPAEADRAKINTGPGENAGTSEPVRRLPAPPTPAQGVQPAPSDAPLRQAFEQFLNEQQQASTSPRGKEALFNEFKNSLANALSRDAALASAEKESTRRIEIWQSLDTTNLRDHAAASSAVIGTVKRGSTFRVIDRSKDGKWLKIETRDGSSGYYWAERAREMR
jgi:hypothetical protein